MRFYPLKSELRVSEHGDFKSNSHVCWLIGVPQTRILLLLTNLAPPLLNIRVLRITYNQGNENVPGLWSLSMGAPSECRFSVDVVRSRLGRFPFVIFVSIPQ
jgi:hypothetical protein